MKKHKTFARRLTDTLLLAGTCVLSANTPGYAQYDLPPIVAGYSQQVPAPPMDMPLAYGNGLPVSGQLTTAPLAGAPMPNAIMPSEMLAPTTQLTSHGLGQHQHGNACYDPCCLPWWAHRTCFFGEALYLAPGNSDIIYAREETDPLLTGSPTGPMGILNIDASVGYRVGGTVALDECTSIFGTYSRWDGQTTNSITATSPNVLNPVLLHPSTLTSGATGIASSGSQDISFQTVDIGYRRVHRIGNSSVINWVAGARYGNLEQQLNVDQTISVATGLTNLQSDIDFEGVGFLAGLDGERQNQCNGLLVYGKAFASFLGGTWKADVSQTNQFGGGIIANHYEDFRLSPVLEAELGGGWQSRCGRVRLTAGYLASGWFNSVSTRDYIQSFQENNFVDLIDTITFSGLTSRAELRW